MSEDSISHRSYASRTFAKCVAVVLSCITALHSNYVQAEDEVAFRARVIKEVLQEIPDLDLALQIVQIRFEREFLKQKNSVAKPVRNDEADNKMPTNKRILIKQPIQVNSEQLTAMDPESNLSVRNSGNLEIRLRSKERVSDYFVGVGNRLVAGYAHPVSTEFSIRADLAGRPTFEGSKSIDGNQFAVTESNASLGGYLDWFPTRRDFRLSIGVNVNRIRTRLQSIQGTNTNVNGKTFNTGSEVLDITYKFPLYTPYLGLGYQSAASDNGWSMYADLGLMFAKYDAYARTSMVGMHAVTVADVDAELNTLRSSLFKSSYVPVGALGIKYRY